ncbi:MAG: glutamate-5-semialdehyde dehydrogenase [Rickettsiales bacterium]
MSIVGQMAEIGAAARAASRVLAQAPTAQKNRALVSAADAIRARRAEILTANKMDMNEADALSQPMRDRLLLNDARIEAMAAGVARVAELPDPVGRVLESWNVSSNGLHFEKVAIPLGVIGMIYESRPNVTADAAAIALKSGNAVILRGGSESLASNRVILAAMRDGFRDAGLPETAAQLVPTVDRAAVEIMLQMHDVLDVLIPRGGKSLTERVQRDARVPTLLHLDGNCHIYLHGNADAAKARSIVLNAKMRRTGVCGALESLLIDRAALITAPSVLRALLEAGCEIRGDVPTQAFDARIVAASEEDWGTEYLAPILSVKIVDGLEAAIAHINQYGSHHTDAIITEDAAAGAQFTREVDSTIVLVNASTQFADGGEFGFGAEIGIATGRLHARGPVGVAQLTTYKYIVTTRRPDGAIRAG